MIHSRCTPQRYHKRSNASFLLVRTDHKQVTHNIIQKGSIPPLTVKGVLHFAFVPLKTDLNKIATILVTKSSELDFTTSLQTATENIEAPETSNDNTVTNPSSSSETGDKYTPLFVHAFCNAVVSEPATTANHWTKIDISIQIPESNIAAAATTTESLGPPTPTPVALQPTSETKDQLVPPSRDNVIYSNPAATLVCGWYDTFALYCSQEQNVHIWIVTQHTNRAELTLTHVKSINVYGTIFSFLISHSLVFLGKMNGVHIYNWKHSASSSGGSSKVSSASSTTIAAARKGGDNSQERFLYLPRRDNQSIKVTEIKLFTPSKVVMKDSLGRLHCLSCQLPFDSDRIATMHIATLSGAAAGAWTTTTTTDGKVSSTAAQKSTTMVKAITIFPSILEPLVESGYGAAALALSNNCILFTKLKSVFEYIQIHKDPIDYVELPKHVVVIHPSDIKHIACTSPENFFVVGADDEMYLYHVKIPS
eukprot:GEZU01025159.1.p1 GENE.GEZU01025159.1~~GEZU01025159.1.p1  ORF type:complete len:479 (-),score=76.61 GEZU01025159.1:10-1446(-)